ncbi:MAG: hypothetical protein V4627_02855 [Pseudomonadota bacterium]
MTRLLTILLLIVLLPLRGWAVERMADDMAAGVMPADCPMLQMVQVAPADTGTSDGKETSPAERTCQSCQLCMSLVAQEMSTLQADQPAPHALAVHSAYGFTSADLPRSIKPPIS